MSTATITRLTPHMIKPKAKTHRNGMNSTARSILKKKVKLSTEEDCQLLGIIQKGFVRIRTIVFKTDLTVAFQGLFGSMLEAMDPLKPFLVPLTGISLELS